MHWIPRDKLFQLIQRYGKELGEDPRRCEALLRDVCGTYRKEIFALVSAVREGIPAELLEAVKTVPHPAAIARYSQKLHENFGISSELCQWTVETWAYALGIVTKRDLLPATRCPSCDVSMKIPTKLHGKEAKCPKCAVPLLIRADGTPALLSAKQSSEQSIVADVRHKAMWPPTEPKQPSGKDSPAAQLGVQAAIAKRDTDGNQASSGHFTSQILLPTSETAIDVFRQVVLRWIAADGGLRPQHFQYFEQARTSLGLPCDAAEKIVREVADRNNTSTQAWMEASTVPPNHTTLQLPSGGAWYVRPTSRGQYGPVDEHTVRRWITEGRVTYYSLLWCEGWADWRPAAEIFPSLVQDLTAQQSSGTVSYKQNNPQIAPSVKNNRTSIPPRLIASGIAMVVLGLLDLGLSLITVVSGDFDPDHLFAGILWFGIGATVTAGGLSAISANYYPLAQIGAIVAILSTCLCNPLSLVGIWAIIVLNDKEVKAAFRR